MILVTVGASEFPFDRLLNALAELPRDEDLVVQHGPSAVRPEGARCVDYVEMSTLEELMREARVVVTHAGVGSILLALRCGRRPFVVPRRHAFGETVDDHQMESARKLEQAGLVRVVEQPSQLGAALASAGETAVARFDGESGLAGELRDYLSGLIDAPRPMVTR